MMATLYVLHFDRPYWTNCQHYIGYTTVPLEERLARHRNGNGSKLVHYTMSKGINFELVHSEEYPTQWEARQAEVKAKWHGWARKYPICKEQQHGK